MYQPPESHRLAGRKGQTVPDSLAFEFIARLPLNIHSLPIQFMPFNISSLLESVPARAQTPRPEKGANDCHAKRES